MDSEIISVAVRVSMNCIVFAYFLFEPFKSRFKYSYFKTALLVLLLSAITVIVSILFLTSGKFFINYSTVGIVIWLFSATLLFHTAIKGSFFELLFIILVVLNLYVNIAAIAKVFSSVFPMNFPFQVSYTIINICVLLAYVPLIWLLFSKIYKPVIELDINFSFWRMIWIIPALTYMMFLIKIIVDYWKSSVPADGSDIAFILLWSFTSYVFYCITITMLVQTYKGTTAQKHADLMVSQLKMQENLYNKLLKNIELTARLRHDWRHHLISINGFVDRGDINSLKKYLKILTPDYSEDAELSFCANHVVNVILQHHSTIAKEHEVNMKISANLPSSLTISDTDLCIIFGNLVENAMEACLKQTDSDKIVEINVDMKAKQLALFFKNTYDKAVICKGDTFYSTKHDGIGIGLSSVKNVVEKNNGIMKITYDEFYFKVYILLAVN